jgi:AcrR family transcriptional regulator
MNYIAERRQEEKERRRVEILAAAEEVTAHAGWDELTMDQVARRARLSRALLYVYFKDKADLMYGICERGMVLLRGRFDEAVSQHPRGLDQVIALGRAYIAFSETYPVYFDIMARCQLREGTSENVPANELAVQAAGDGMTELIVQVIHAGLRDGSIRTDLGNPMVAAMALWGFLNGALQVVTTKAKILDRTGVDARRMLEQSVQLAAHAIAART